MKDQCQIPLIVVGFLGSATILLCVGVLGLSYAGKPVDGGLTTLAGTGLGSLATLLTNLARGGNRATDPVVPPVDGATTTSFTTSSATVQTATDGGDDETTAQTS